MKVVVIDNYDSFTFNLCQIVRELGTEVTVLKNDTFVMSDLEVFDKIIFSPGPGLPSEAGKMEEIIRNFVGRKPMLGVCLGEQAIGEVFGAKLKNLEKVYHGMQSCVRIIDPTGVFEGLSEKIQVGRYHSWVVDTVGFPDDLCITAMSDDGNIMGLRHRFFPIYGIQFHPESILTPDGKQMIANFLFK